MTTTTVPAAESADQTVPAPARTVYRIQICNRCETVLAPDATHCPVCTGQCGGPCCGGAR